MPIEVKKKEGESLGSFLFRFNKRIRRSGVLKETKRRRFHSRNVNRNKRRSSALYRIQKKKKVAQQRKYGHS